MSQQRGGRLNGFRMVKRRLAVAAGQAVLLSTINIWAVFEKGKHSGAQPTSNPRTRRNLQTCGHSVYMLPLNC